MTESNKNLRSYGFIINRQRWADCDGFMIRVLVREGAAESPVNPRGEGESTFWDAPKKTAGMMLSGLTIRVYASESRNETRIILRPACFEDIHYCEVDVCKKMLKTYAAIDREFERADRPQEVGDYVGVVAKAIGATWMAVTQERDARYSMYRDTYWRWESIGALKSEVRSQWAQLEREGARVDGAMRLLSAS